MILREAFLLNFHRLVKEKNSYGITNKEMAELIGISERRFYQWYKGTVFPRPEGLEKVADFFRVPAVSLLKENTN